MTHDLQAKGVGKLKMKNSDIEKAKSSEGGECSSWGPWVGVLFSGQGPTRPQGKTQG